ncbi:MAG TPA: 4-hydroxyphenylacetate 3-hydroxylase N-terminal domain-containing protein [Solirubrobacteraceae bacterium]|jgi:aromatic ring hydroxylase
MALHTADELTERLSRRRGDFRWRGQVLENVIEHPDFMPTLLSWGGWLYQAAFDPETAETVVARPDFNGEDCHVFWHIATSAEDLLQNLKAAQLLAERSPLTGYASIGRDELHALLVATHDLDRQRGTGYHARVTEYVKRFQREQLMTAAAVTDLKGNRSLRPGQQDDPDMYLRVVDRTDQGIIVRGAKAHTSGSVGAEELIVIPTRAMREDEEQYAVSFAIPVDAPGITLVARALNAGSDSAWEAPISSHDELAETFTIFNDVFVPYERVFLLGEWEYAGDVANAFASVNRQGYLGTESGKLRLFIGAAQRIAELNGVASVSHIREKITQLIRMERSIWALGVAASLESHSREPGYQIPDPVLTNAGKHVCMESHFTACRLLLEIAGGAVTTAPLLEDLQAPDIKPLVEKYFRGADPDSAWERLRVFKLIRDLAASEYSGYWNTEIIHGSGSPAAEVLAMYRETDLDACKALVARALQGRDAIAPAATTTA